MKPVHRPTHFTSLCGLPSLLLPTPGPTTGGMTFRAGVVDDPINRVNLVSQTATAAIEKVQRSFPPETDIEASCAVDDLTTTIAATGDVTHVGQFLTRLSTSFNGLNTQPDSGQPIAAELHERQRFECDYTLTEFYGMNGLARRCTPPFGTSLIDSADIATCARRYFNQQNVVVWFTSEPPNSLNIDLPYGLRQPVSRPKLLAQHYPVGKATTQNSVCIAARVRRSPVSELCWRLMVARMHDKRRSLDSRGITISSGFQVADDIHAHAWIQLNPSSRCNPQTVQTMLDEFSECAQRPVTEDDLTSVRAEFKDEMNQTENVHARLTREATDMLLGTFTPYWIAELSDITSAQMTLAVLNLLHTCVVLIPARTNADVNSIRFDGKTLSPPIAAELQAVNGRRYRYKFSAERMGLLGEVISEAGITHETKNGFPTITITPQNLAVIEVDGTHRIRIWSEQGEPISFEAASMREASAAIEHALQIFPQSARVPFTDLAFEPSLLDPFVRRVDAIDLRYEQFVNGFGSKLRRLFTRN